MLDLCRLIFGIASDLLRSRVALEAEILVLRQQINVLRRANPKKLRFVSIGRLISGGVCRLFPKMYGALAEEVPSPHWLSSAGSRRYPTTHSDKHTLHHSKFGCRMSLVGQSLPKWAARRMSVFPPIATELRTSLEVRFVPILLQKSFRGGERKFLEPLMHFTRGDVRDHIVSSKIDHGPPQWR
jgi:hypothetical protein